MKPVDLTEVLNIEARMRIRESSPVADALKACAIEIAALREICATRHVTVESNPRMQKLCEDLLDAPMNSFDTTYTTEELVEILGGIFKVTILAQGHTNG